MAHGPFYNPANKVVYDGDTANAADLNAINSATDSGFQQVATDLDTLESNQTNWEAQAEKWAVDNQGTNPDPTQPDDYSAYANAKEAEGHASEVEDTPVTGADGLSTGTYSALHHAAKSSASADAASTSASNAATSETNAAASAAEAEAYKDSALGANTILYPSVQQNITINRDGAGPYEYEVVHATMGDGVTTHPAVPLGNKLIYSITTDSNGHVTATTEVDGDTVYLGITAQAADSDKLNGQLASFYATQTDLADYLPLAGGTVTGDVTLSGGDILIGAQKVRYDATGGYVSLSANGWALYAGTPHTSWLSMDASNCYMNFANLTVNRGLEIRTSGVARARFFATTGGGANIYAGNALIEVTGDLTPTAGTYDLGSTSLRWSKGWFTNIDTVNAVVVSSDINKKKNIKVLDSSDTDWIFDLSPISFKWKDSNKGNKLHYGFSAQEMEEKEKSKEAHLVKKQLKEGGDPNNPDDYDWGIAPTELIAPMLAVIKDQKQLIEDLQARVAVLEAV